MVITYHDLTPELTLTPTKVARKIIGSSSSVPLRPSVFGPYTQMELQAMINEKKAELERLNLQHESLQRVEADQKALIEKLTNNEA